MDFPVGFVLGLMLGFVGGILFFVSTQGDNNLAWQRANYYDCVSIGAPQQNCLEKYLLPKAKP